jgi:hypothetical protein
MVSETFISIINDDGSTHEATDWLTNGFGFGPRIFAYAEHSRGSDQLWSPHIGGANRQLPSC